MRSRHPSTKPGLDSIPSGVFAEILNEEAARSAEENVTAGEFAAATEALRKDLKLRESQRIFDWDPIAEQQGQTTPEVDHEALRARLEGAGLRVPSAAQTEEEAPKGAANAGPSNSGNSGNSGSSDTAPASPRALKAREPRQESVASDEPEANGREADEPEDDDRSPPPPATLATRGSRGRERSHAAPASGAITGAMLWTGVGLVLAAVLVLVYVAIDRDLFRDKKTARPGDSAGAAQTASGTPLKASPTAEPVATSPNATASSVDAAPSATATTSPTVAPSSTPSASDTAKAATTASPPSTASTARGPDPVRTATQKTATAPTVTAPPTPSTTGKTPYFERSPRP